MRSLLFCLVLLTLTLPASDRPNIIVILADDQGFGDLGANNPQSKIATPHLDALAKGGVRFTDGHTSSGVCTPTRYSLLTGRYHWRTRLQSGVLGGFSSPLIAKDRLTLAGLLKQQGYATGCFGKWHLGMSFPLVGGGYADDGGDFSKNPKDAGKIDFAGDIVGGPVEHGFDTFYGISASLDMPPFVWIKDRRMTEVPSATKTWLRTGPAGPKFEAVEVMPSVIDQTIAFIEGQQKADPAKPFFAYVPLNAPHTPIVPIKEFQGSSGISPYADFVKQVDHDVGRLLAALDKQGLTENTLVIFTSDNGCSTAANIPELQKAGHEPGYVYRGNKADLYEGGHRVPFLVRWPAKVKPAVSAALIGQFDFLATFAEITGAPVPPGMGEDSVSFLPVLLGSKESVRQGIVSQSINGSFAIRDGQWKLLLSAGSAGWSSPKPGPEEAGLPPVQLYDLSNDPGERNNLQAQFPERVAAMKAELEKLIARGRSTPGPDLANDVPVQLIKKSPAAKAKAKTKK
jgi:arylsulfatase A-like enzyme